MAAILCSSRLERLDDTGHRGQKCNPVVPMDTTAKYQEPDDIRQILRMLVSSDRDNFATGEQGVD